MGSTTRGAFLFMSFLFLLFVSGSILCAAGLRRKERGAVKINGQECKLTTEISLLEYLQQQNYPLACIAVEYNGNILAREQYGAVILQPEDCLEIVSFVGGG